MSGVILVQPKVGFIDKVVYETTIPLALLSISRLIKNEFTVTIIDQRVEKNWRKKLLKELKKQPICVGLTSYTGKQIAYALEISKFVKQNSDIPIVWGGVHASSMPRQTLENPYVDIVIKGEGEVTFYELVRALKRNKPLKDIRGLWYKDNGKIKSNVDRPFLDLNKLPDIPYGLINIDHYPTKVMGERTIYMESSRGCPFNCSFCYNLPYYECKWRYLNTPRLIENVLKVKTIFGNKIKNIRFSDSNFFASRKRTNEFVHKLKKESMDINWDAQAHVKSLAQHTHRELEEMEKSNFKNVFIGIESGSDRILKLLNKSLTLPELYAFNKKLSKTKILPQ